MDILNQSKSKIIMVNKTLIIVVKFSFVVIIVLSGISEFIWQMCFSKVPIGLVLVILLSLGILYARIPPPDPQTVKAILGSSLSLEKPFHKGDYFVKTIAHRGAGLDAPENSLPAFNMVSIYAQTVLILENDLKINAFISTRQLIESINLVDLIAE